jgi:hypothetical protein
VRELFAQAEGGDYQLFVFHDADIDGYEIARVLGNATRRMPDHNVDVIDIGLDIADAVEMGLDSEPYFRKGGVPYRLRRRLSDLEREYFRDSHGERFELNAILPDSRRIEYIERKLEENGVRGKVIPPEEKLGELAKEKYHKEHAERVSRLLDEVLGLDDIKKALADEFEDKFELDAARSAIEKGFEKEPALSWRGALENKLKATLDEHNDGIRDALREKIVEVLKGDGRRG